MRLHRILIIPILFVAVAGLRTPPAAAGPTDALAAKFKEMKAALTARSGLVKCLSDIKEAKELEEANAAIDSVDPDAQTAIGSSSTAADTDHTGYMSHVMMRARAKMAEHFAHIMKPQLDGLAEEPDAKGQRVSERASEGVKAFSSLGAMGNCFANAAHGYATKVKAVFGKIGPALETASLNMFKAHVVKPLNTAIIKGFVKVITMDGATLSETELSRIVNTYYARYLIRQLVDGIPKLKEYKSAPTDDTWKKFAATLLPSDGFTAELKVTLTVEVVRSIAHQYINDDSVGRGGYYINEAVGILQLAEGTTSRMVSSVCGLIPEAGAAICNATLLQGVDIVWNGVVIPAIRAKVKALVKDAIDRAINYVELKVKAKMEAKEQAAAKKRGEEALAELHKDYTAHDTTATTALAALTVATDKITELLLRKFADVGTSELRSAVERMQN
jgi:hypothetical protein